MTFSSIAGFIFIMAVIVGIAIFSYRHMKADGDFPHVTGAADKAIDIVKSAAKDAKDK